MEDRISDRVFESRQIRADERHREEKRKDQKDRHTGIKRRKVYAVKAEKSEAEVKSGHAGIKEKDDRNRDALLEVLFKGMEEILQGT